MISTINMPDTSMANVSLPTPPLATIPANPFAGRDDADLRPERLEEDNDQRQYRIYRHGYPMDSATNMREVRLLFSDMAKNNPEVLADYSIGEERVIPARHWQNVQAFIAQAHLENDGNSDPFSGR